MSTKLVFCFIVLVKLSHAQLNGEFWWLNDKVKQLKGIEPPLPNFEELNEFDTDESSKIIFRDDEFPIRSIPGENNGNVNNTNKQNPNLLNTSKIFWPDHFISPKKPANEQSNHLHEDFSTEAVSLISNENNKQTANDFFLFKFPDDNSAMKTKIPINSMEAKQVIAQINKTDYLNKVTPPKTINPTINKDLITFKYRDGDLNAWRERPPIMKHEKLIVTNNLQNERNSDEIICIYMNKRNCYEGNGDVYMSKTAKRSERSRNGEVCCVLPEENKHKIVFPDTSTSTLKRYKRSNIEVTSINQRDFLLRKKFGTQSNKFNTPNPRIVTPDDEYVDPYWNIKNTNLKNSQSQSIIKPDCYYHDYVEDYVAELPKPGLVGIYSDHGPKSPSWTKFDESPKQSYGASFDYSYEDDETSFGYSTVDPRRGSSSKTPKRKRPNKVTTLTPEDVTFDVGSQAVNFQSNPNFQVLQGFKLLNLARTKNRFYSKNTKRSTTESSIEIENESVKIENNDNIAHIYEQCGKTITNTHDSQILEKSMGETEIGSHPWLAVVVSSKKPQNILCYATIVHPRAAITAGDCFSNYAKQTSSKEIFTVIAGLHNIKDKTQSQSRVAIIQLHPQWRQGNLAHNLALLYWSRPLRLSVNIQPACLKNSLRNEDCKFYGWGGFDQDVHQQPRWQKASIISTQNCHSLFSKVIKISNDAFCVTVQTRGTVTGLGGSLICNIDGRAFATGVAVHRDNALVLIPAHEWARLAMRDLNIE